MIIGGEFALNIDDISYHSTGNRKTEELYTFASGRGALYAVFSYLKENLNIKRILLPEYLCLTIVDTVRLVNLEYDYIPLTVDLLPDREKFNKVLQKDDAILIINYFGVQTLDNIIQYLKEEYPETPIIEDDVQAFYEFWYQQSRADFKITSLRKTFAIPDGGLVKTNFPLKSAEGINHFYKYKVAGGILKSLTIDDKRADNHFLSLLRQGEDLIQSDIKASISAISKSLFECQNLRYVEIKRKENAKYLIEGLQKLGIKPLLPIKESSVPLFVPIYLKNRDSIRMTFAQQNIYCPVHWPADTRTSNSNKELIAHELSLVIDQRYGYKEMNRLLTLLKELI